MPNVPPHRTRLGDIDGVIANRTLFPAGSPLGNMIGIIGRVYIPDEAMHTKDVTTLGHAGRDRIAQADWASGGLRLWRDENLENV